ncbi:MAG TPA: hypothetical protein VJW76_10115 [Verrucomicrobiae bacterium]|nr:hypothetical protein [Verrucomicrobiae bacterium]
MNSKLGAIALLACLPLAVHAAVPPPEKLLPADTLGVITVPDYAKARTVYGGTPACQLWRDPAMKPFVEKLEKKLVEEVITPLERDLGVKLADYAGLAQGQFTFAVIQNGWEGKEDRLPAWLVLIDSKEKSSQLKTNLADLRKKWIDGGKKLKTEKIRDVEFTTLVVSGEDVAKTLEKSLADSKTEKSEKPEKASEDADNPAAKKTEITVGQSDSLLIAGSDPKVIEKILIRQSGGPVPSLGEQTAFETDYQARLRNALVYGWVHFKPIVDILNRLASEASKESDDLAVNPTKVVSATGIAGLKTVSFLFNETSDGSFGELHFAVPAAGRGGVFKIISAEAKDSNPPPFVPADAVQFQRWRLDVQKAWNTLEGMLVEISPQFGGVFKLMFENVGKDKDPNFDMRRELVGNLGDDLITFQKSPRGNTFAELNSPPSLYLIGSPNSDKLAGALKMLTSLLPPALSNVKEREFLGRKIYSLSLPPTPSPDGSSTIQRTLSYAASGGYIALSTDDAILETYLRSSENTGKTLRESPGLAEAAEKIGGMNTGLFGYENSSETMRVMLETLKNDSGNLEKMLAVTPLGPKLSGKDGGGLKAWLDFSLLPSFDKIAKYFYFTVYSGSVTPEGLSYKMFSPTPPQLKK